MKELSEHVYMSDDEEIACVRDVNENYILLSRLDVFYEKVFDTLNDVQEFIKLYDASSEEEKKNLLENGRA